MKLTNQIGSPTMLLVVGAILFSSSCDISSEDIPTQAETLEGIIEEAWQSYADGDFERAIELFNQALERNVEPDSLGIQAYQGLGWAYSRVNKYALSISNFNFLLSVESVRSGKNPIVEMENTVAESNPFPLAPTIEDTFGVGIWTIETDSNTFLLSISGIESYAAEKSHRITVGSLPNKIEPGTRLFTLDKASISNPDGDGMGTSTSSSLWFEPATNIQGDSLVNPVSTIDDIDSLYDYYLNAEEGEVAILPRYWQMENLTAHYEYYEKTYMIRNFGYHLISLEEELEDGNDLPIIDPESYEGGDKYYISGESFNKDRGGTYYQADAFAGMAAGFAAQGDYEGAIRAARMAIFINEYLEDGDPGNYPYVRNLFEGDTGFDTWNIYHVLAVSYFNLKDFRNAERCIEQYMGKGDVLDPTSATYEYDMVERLSSMVRPSDWEPPQIW